jgi:quinol monooxygenase YgiN
MKAVIVTYVVKKGHEAEFEKILRKHWKLLRSEKLTTDQLPFLLRDPESPMVYKEIFEWKSRHSFQKAHESQRVQKLWNQMKKLTEKGGIEPAHFKRI